MNYKNNKFVNEISFVTAKTDATSQMDIYLKGEIDAVSRNYYKPAVLHFQAITSDSAATRATIINKIVDLKIPLIPVEYELGSSSELNSFLKNGTPEIIKNRESNQNNIELNKRITNYKNRVLNYLYFSLSMAYINALNSHDKTKIDIIENLKMMENFDFESLKILKEANFKISSSDSGNFYINKNNEKIALSSTSFDKLNKILKLFKKAAKDEEKFKFLNHELETFNPYQSQMNK